MFTGFDLTAFATEFNGPIALMLSAPVIVWGAMRAAKFGIHTVKRLFGRI